MAYVIKNGEQVAYGLKTYMVEDLNELGTMRAKAGDKALVLSEGGATYIMSEKGKWQSIGANGIAQGDIFFDGTLYKESDADDFTWELLENETVKIIKCNKLSQFPICAVPARINGYPVKQIASGAFDDWTVIQKLFLPEDITLEQMIIGGTGFIPEIIMVDHNYELGTIATFFPQWALFTNVIYVPEYNFNKYLSTYGEGISTTPLSRQFKAMPTFTALSKEIANEREARLENEIIVNNIQSSLSNEAQARNEADVNLQTNINNIATSYLISSLKSVAGQSYLIDNIPIHSTVKIDIILFNNETGIAESDIILIPYYPEVSFPGSIYNATSLCGLVQALPVTGGRTIAEDQHGAYSLYFTTPQLILDDKHSFISARVYVMPTQTILLT